MMGLVFCLVGCALDRDDVNLTFRLGAREAAPPLTAPEPWLRASTPLEFACLGVNIVGSGIDSLDSEDTDLGIDGLLGGNACSYPGIGSQLVDVVMGSESEVEFSLKKGTQRLFQVLGVQTTKACDNVPGIAALLKGIRRDGNVGLPGYGRIVELGRLVHDVTKSEAVTIPNTYSEGSARDLRLCNRRSSFDPRDHGLTPKVWLRADRYLNVANGTDVGAAVPSLDWDNENTTSPWFSVMAHTAAGVTLSRLGAPNFFPTLSFTGSNNTHHTVSPTVTLTAFTAYLVGKITANVAMLSLNDTGGGCGVTINNCVELKSFSGTAVIIHKAAGAASTSGSTGVNIGGSYRLFKISWQSGQTGAVRILGSASDDSDAFSFGGTSLSVQYVNLGPNFDGQIAEVLIFDSRIADSGDVVLDYLKDRYGLDGV